MNERLALQTIDALLLEMNATWGNRFFPLQPDRLPTIRRRWMKTLIHSTPEIIVEAFEMFVTAGSENPPTLPAFRKAVDDIAKQRALQYSNKQKAIRGSQTSEVAKQSIAEIKDILRRTGMKLDLPWLR